MTAELPLVDKRALPCCGIAETAPEDLGHVAAVFKALCDETRLKILQAISRTGELCECNIVPSFGLSQPTISYHLKVLREAGLIRSDRRGQWVYHQVNSKALLGAVRRLAEMG